MSGSGWLDREVTPRDTRTGCVTRLSRGVPAMKLHRPALVALGLSTAALCTFPASADGTSIAVPSVGPKTVSTTFSGTFPVGANVASWAAGDTTGCQGDSPSQFVESHPIRVAVP